MPQVLCCLSLPLVQLCVIVAAQVGDISIGEGNMFHSVTGHLIGRQKVLNALISYYMIHLHIYMTEHFLFGQSHSETGSSLYVTVLPLHDSFCGKHFAGVFGSRRLGCSKPHFSGSTKDLSIRWFFHQTFGSGWVVLELSPLTGDQVT